MIGQELNMRLLQVDPDDPERLTEVMVQFARGLAFRVAVFEIRAEIPLMQVSDQLTWIAEAVVSEVLRYAYSEMVTKHGQPVRLGTIVRMLWDYRYSDMGNLAASR